MIPNKNEAKSYTEASIQGKLQKERKYVEDSIDYAIRNGKFSVDFTELSQTMREELQSLGYTVQKAGDTDKLDAMAIMRGAFVWIVSWKS